MKFPRNIKVLSAVVTALQALCAAALLLGANGFAAPGIVATSVAAPKVAIVTTTRQPTQPAQLAQLQGQTFAALQPAAAAPQAPSAQTIYKLVDAEGRTTYANSPMTGAQKVALPDLTIMDSQWPSALANATAGNTATASPLPAPIIETTNPPLPLAAPIAVTSAAKPTAPSALKAAPPPFSMVPVGNGATINSAPLGSAKLILASNTNAPAPASVSFAAMAVAQQAEAPQPPLSVFEKLRAESAIDPQLLATSMQRRKMFEAELRQEENLVREIRQTLSKDEAESANFRLKTQELAQALKKNITPSAEQKNAKEALLAHFERKRLLQDELGAHERTAEALREVLRAR